MIELPSSRTAYWKARETLSDTEINVLTQKYTFAVQASVRDR